MTIAELCAAIATDLRLSSNQAYTLMLLVMIAFNVAIILFATALANQRYWAQTLVLITIMPWALELSSTAATVVLSNSMPDKDQDLAASSINTVVNYSISISLGISGTVVSQVTEKSKSVLTEYCSCFYYQNKRKKMVNALKRYLKFVISRNIQS